MIPVIPDPILPFENSTDPLELYDADRLSYLRDRYENSDRFGRNLSVELGSLPNPRRLERRDTMESMSRQRSIELGHPFRLTRQTPLLPLRPLFKPSDQCLGVPF